MTPDDLRALARIAGLIADRDLARLAKARAEGAALAEAAAKLARRAPAPSSDALDPATRAGAGARWDRWRKEELRRLQLERARHAAREAELRADAQRAFGRKTALDELGTSIEQGKR